MMISTLFAGEYYLSVKVEEANFRTDPDLESRVKWDLEKYYPLAVKQKQGDWYEVTDYLGNKGWVHQITVDQPCRTVIVNGNDVNIRQGPGLDQEVVSSAYKGEIFFIVADKDDWLEVEHTVDSRSGFIYKDLVWGI